MKIFTFIAFCAMLINYNVQGQELRVTHTNTDKPVVVGDKVPDVSFAISNYKTPTAKISDFKGKPVILDLWSVYCGACIYNMPKMAELQEEFKDRLQIILVTKDKQPQVDKLAARAANVKNNKLPMVTGEAPLAWMFSYRSVPRYIWIDSEGKVKYTAESREVTSENIKAFLAGEKLAIEEKVDIQITKPGIPWLVQAYPYFGNDYGVYSYLAPLSKTKYKYGGGRGRHSDDDGKLMGLYHGSSTIMELYLLAYDYKVSWNDRRVLMEFRDAAKYIPDYDSVKNLYKYELLMGKLVPEQRIFKYMQNELDFYFNVESSLQKRPLPCLVLKRLPGFKKLSNSPDQKQNVEVASDRVKAINAHWYGVLNSMGAYSGSRFKSPYEFVDETGITLSGEPVDIDIVIDYTDLKRMNQSLEKYGLVISREDRTLDVIVLSDPK